MLPGVAERFAGDGGIDVVGDGWSVLTTAGAVDPFESEIPVSKVSPKVNVSCVTFEVPCRAQFSFRAPFCYTHLISRTDAKHHCVGGTLVTLLSIPGPCQGGSAPMQAVMSLEPLGILAQSGHARFAQGHAAREPAESLFAHSDVEVCR